uniref:hypothetical protein n=1 Tax=Nonomuraea pusilla TaxID=46177 RepID=UPI000B13EE3F|nr:hypothetical protein [Nonomuraea pusilla]
MTSQPPAPNPSGTPYERGRVDERLALAVRDNAEWCERMCRAHGLPGAFGERVWTNPRRTPLYYPDAVTLSPQATAADVLGAIDTGSGASVKDSFALLDLPGFEVLFDAQWIHREAPEPGELPGRDDGGLVWEAVADTGGLAEWERACFSGEVTGLFPPALLPEVTVLAGRAAGDVVCGAVLNPGEHAVGVSNVFAVPGHDPGTAWAGVLTQAAALFPGLPLVGYESDPAAAEKHGFRTIGPLRIWLKP